MQNAVFCPPIFITLLSVCFKVRIPREDTICLPSLPPIKNSLSFIMDIRWSRLIGGVCRPSSTLIAFFLPLFLNTIRLIVVKVMKSTFAAEVTFDLPLLCCSSYETIYDILCVSSDKERWNISQQNFHMIFKTVKGN